MRVLLILLLVYSGIAASVVDSVNGLAWKEEMREYWTTGMGLFGCLEDCASGTAQWDARAATAVTGVGGEGGSIVNG